MWFLRACLLPPRLEGRSESIGIDFSMLWLCWLIVEWVVTDVLNFPNSLSSTTTAPELGRFYKRLSQVQKDLNEFPLAVMLRRLKLLLFLRERSN